jgi:hypothetical protein
MGRRSHARHGGRVLPIIARKPDRHNSFIHNCQFSDDLCRVIHATVVNQYHFGYLITIAALSFLFAIRTMTTPLLPAEGLH